MVIWGHPTDKSRKSGLLLVNLGFWIFRFADCRFSSFFFCELCLKNILVRYRGINNKGVMERPWTKWRVLSTISSTLKCQFTGKHENEKIRLFGETEHRRPGVYKVAHHFSAHFCRARTPSIAIWGKQIGFWTSFSVFSFFPNSLLGSA